MLLERRLIKTKLATHALPAYSVLLTRMLFM